MALKGLEERSALIGGVLSIDLPFRLDGVLPPVSLLVESAGKIPFAAVNLQRLRINQTQRVEFTVKAEIIDDAEAFTILKNMSIAGITIHGSGLASASFLRLVNLQMQ